MRPPTNQEAMNVYSIRIPETGDFANAFPRLQWYASIILLILTQQKAKTYRQRIVVENTNVKKNR